MPLVRDEGPERLNSFQRFYEAGLKRGLGVNLNVYCFVDGAPCCYVWIPEDEVDASYRMLNGLKLSVPTETDRRVVAAVRSRIYWPWLKVCEKCRRRSRWADDIPHRKGCEP